MNELTCLGTGYGLVYKCLGVHMQPVPQSLSNKCTSLFKYKITGKNLKQNDWHFHNRIPILQGAELKVDCHVKA